jgi:hypothetical protein
MNKRSAKVYRDDGPLSSRRQFLAGAIGAAASVYAWPVWAITDSKVPHSRVALLENPRLMTDIGIVKRLLVRLFEEGLCISLNKPSPAAAWRSILREDDRILLKFSIADADRLATSEMMAEVLIESLMDAGFEPARITPLEVRLRTAWSDQLAKPAFGWTEKVYDFGSGREQLVKAVEDATAILNVPFLKAHRIAGMTGCLKNLSHGLIRRPALYHDNQCCPCIPDVVAMPVIRDKLRLNVVNALRIIYDTRPDAARDPVDIASALVISTDPVAADTIGQTVLDAMRREKALAPVTPEPGMVLQHRLAAAKGLGFNNLELIDLVRPAGA